MWGVVYAAGSGERFGGFKQFEHIGESRLVDRCVAALASVCDHLVVVLPASVDWTGPAVSAVVTGGATNPDSVRAGLAAIAADAAVIVLHSPSHPLASPALARRVVEHLATGVDGVCPVAPIHDAVRRLDDHGDIVETVPMTLPTSSSRLSTSWMGATGHAPSLPFARSATTRRTRAGDARG